MISAFDQIANNYDETFTLSKIGKAQREVVHKYLDENLPWNKSLNVLELNCGTGEDAIYLAKKGYSVLATDLSENMIIQAKRKIKEKNLEDKIKVRQLDILKIGEEQFGQKFDLIFSDFGGLNCINEADLINFSRSVKKHLNDSGRLIFVIMTNFCIWEKLYFLLKLKFEESTRRRSNSGVSANLNGGIVQTFYYSPKEIKKNFNKDFSLISQKPVGLFIPPSYLEKFFKRKIKSLNLLKKLEMAFYKYSFLSSFSDHFIIDFCLKQ